MGATVKVRFLVDWIGEFKAGTIHDVVPALAAQVAKSGLAEAVDGSLSVATLEPFPEIEATALDPAAERAVLPQASKRRGR